VHHEGCGHDHGHAHTSPWAHKRYEYSATEIEAFRKLSTEELHTLVGESFHHEEFGKAVPLQEILLEKESANDWGHLVSTRYLLALGYFQIGDIAKSAPLLKQAVLDIAKVDEPWMTSEAYSYLIKCYAMQHAHADARTTLSEALRFAQKHEQRAWEGLFLHESGALEAHEGHLASAKDFFKRAMELRREISDKHGMASTALQLGLLSEAEKKTVDARNYLEQGLILARSDEELEEIRTEIEKALARINNAELSKKLDMLKKL
jgi:tetratricopeptide (TPR) repeat protein